MTITEAREIARDRLNRELTGQLVEAQEFAHTLRGTEHAAQHEARAEMLECLLSILLEEL